MHPEQDPRRQLLFELRPPHHPGLATPVGAEAWGHQGGA
jgi:hypothetical protein